jgi:hypothetical protein
VNSLNRCPLNAVPIGVIPGKPVVVVSRTQFDGSRGVGDDGSTCLKNGRRMRYELLKSTSGKRRKVPSPGPVLLKIVNERIMLLHRSDTHTSSQANLAKI